MRSVMLLGIALAVITLAVYWQVGNHEFINFDDDIYVYDNVNVATGLNKTNVAWAFTSGHAANWHPLTWLSHMADVEIYGLNPRGHHLANVFIHIAATLLLFVLLFRLTAAPWQSAFVAALFALHPLHVESVAWVAERKDVLSAFFWFLTLLLYVEYVRKNKFALYLLALCAFVLGLMSKPMLVTLPAIMLLLDFWPLNRFSLAEQTPGQRCWCSTAKGLLPLLKEKLPFFAGSLAVAVITVYVQQGGAIKSIDMVPLGLRFANATIAYLKYLGKMLWPADLALLYPLPASIPAWQVVCSLIILLAITGAVLRAGRRQPYLVTGWFWFLITLVPVIGLVQVGAQSIADRYTYIPSVGLFIVLAWGGAGLAKNLQYRQRLLAALATVMIIVSAGLTWQQLKYWQDSTSLYRQTLKVTSGNYLIHFSYGIALDEKGLLDEAIAEFKKAISIYPNYIDAYNNLGISLSKKGLRDEAIETYKKVVTIKPDYADTHNNLGVTYMENGQMAAAVDSFKTAIYINPKFSEAYNNLGVAFAREKRFNAAVDEFKKALAVDPGNVNAQKNLALALELQ